MKCHAKYWLILDFMRATHSQKVGTGSNKRPEKLNVHIVTNGLRHGDPFAAFIRDKVKQANIKQGYREQRRQGRVEIRGRAMGQGRRQTERITRKQAGSERQAANNQERESTV